MRYSFKDMLDAEIYETAQVAFVLGKYNIFNNLVSDELKAQCTSTMSIQDTIGLGDEFGVELDDTEEEVSNSVDFDTFMEVNGVASISGRWFCRTDYSALNKKQKDLLKKYIKSPSPNGLLVVVSDNWLDYKDILKIRSLNFNKYCHIIELSFPHRDVLKGLVRQMFEEKEVEITPKAIELFIMKMSVYYDKYDETITKICEDHGKGELGDKDLRVYMKNIEYYDINDFIVELTKPLSSAKTNNKKVLRIMINLEDSKGSKNLAYEVLKLVNEYIDFRILINTGYIPIYLNYYFPDVIKTLPEDCKYAKMSEWQFRKKASIAARTSLRDWNYMKLILDGALINKKVSDQQMDKNCQKALYELCTRSVLSGDRLNNILKLDNIFEKQSKQVDRVIYNEEALNKIMEIERIANSEEQ